MRPVPADQSQVMLQSGRRNKDVRIANQLTSSAQFTTDARKSSHCLAIQSEHIHIAEKLPKSPLILRWVASKIDTLVNLSKGNNADSQPLSRQLR